MAVPRYEKPPILASIPLDQHAVIEASAGTGKTFTLEHLIIELLLAGVTIDQILVVTFTEKATTELRIRVRAKLDELLMLEEGEGAAESEGPTWELDERARRRLQRALQSFDSATIATIHSFCQRVLTEHAFANRRLFNQEQVDSRHVFSLAYKEALREELAREPSAQRYLKIALAHGLGVEALEEKLYACFNARGELRPAYNAAKLKAVLDAAPHQAIDDVTSLRTSLKAAKVHGTTINAIAARLEALAPLLTRYLDHGDELRFLAEFEQLSAADKYDRGNGVLAYVLQKLDGLVLSGPAASVVDWVRDAQRAIVPLLAALVQAFLPTVRVRLDRRKREGGLFDFDDMLSMVQESIHGAHGPQLLRALRSRYRCALIDEFQDTDEVQWDIFRTVFFESDRSNVLYLIGDPKQAIYGFRGAEVHTYVKATREVIAAGGSHVTLDKNYRSTPELIAAYNQILDQRAQPPFFSGADIGYDKPVSAGDETQAAIDFTDAKTPAVHVFPMLGKLTSVDVLRQVGLRIAAEVRSLLDEDRPSLVAVRGESRRIIRARDIFVLTATRREGTQIGVCLREAGIAHAYYKQDGLFQQDEAAHVLDLLAALVDPHHPGKRLRAWMTPFFGLSLDDAARCRHVPAEHPLSARLFDFAALAHEKRYEELFNQIIEQTGVLRRSLLLREGEREISNYQHIFELLLEEVGRSRCSVRELYFTLKSYIDDRRRPLGDNPGLQRLESDRDAVQIMTMHKSKGLEAQVVFVAGGFQARRGTSTVETYHASGKRCAHVMSRICPDDVRTAIERDRREEHERLLYVALTRARSRLYLPYFPQEKGGFNCNGAYSRVNDRLVAMVAEGLDARFLLRAADPPPSIDVESQSPASGSIALWTPPEDVLDVLTHGETASMRAERQRRKGPFLTSYTAMQKGHEPEPIKAEGEGEGEDLITTRERGEDDLPGGAAPGIFLHDCIESLPFASLEGTLDVEQWRSRPEVARVFAELARVHDIEARHLPHAAQLVYATLTRPIDLGVAGVIEGLHRADKHLCEMEFLFPLPDARAHFDEDDGGPERAPSHVRGFVKGFIDYLFEYRGLCFFADWKSDSLRSWAPSHVSAHVRSHYPRQMQLYSLALCKMLGIRTERDYDARFGGMVYCFMRGMIHGDGVGIHVDRPSWDTIIGWDEDLRHFDKVSNA